jgi:hypothetical protein
VRRGSDHLRVQNRYDPAEAPAFETAEQTEEEDRLRARTLIKAAAAGDVPVSQALRLAARLNRATHRKGPPTLASSCYMTHLRRRVVSNVWPLMEAAGYTNLSTVTLIPSKWSCSPSGLQFRDAGDMMRTITADLKRVGAGDLAGWAYGALHGEWGIKSERYDPHGHFIAAGDMRDAFEALRDLPKYRPTDRVTTPVRISQKRLHSMPDPLTYVLQRYWPARWRGIIGDDKRSSERKRIPAPHLAKQLLWIDQFTITDIECRIGLTNDREGHLVVTA